MGRISKTGSTLVRAFAWVLFAAGVRTALQADLLAAAGRDGEALGRHGFGAQMSASTLIFLGMEDSG